MCVLDISQTFDCVCHYGRLHKLKSFLPPAYYLLIKSYFSEHRFQILYGSAVINSGVLQGGLLPSIVYSIFVCDQPTTFNTSEVDYADNKLLISINVDACINLLQILTFVLIIPV